MPYTELQKAKIKTKIFAKITTEFSYAETDEDIDGLIKKYGVHFDEGPICIVSRQMKILVFGSLSGRVDDYILAARKLGINSDRIVFENDYSKLGRFDTEKLRNSAQYSDIIVGPNPHKQGNTGGYSSLISKIKNNQSEFPRLIEANANHSLKITVSNFRNALLETRLIENAAYL